MFFYRIFTIGFAYIYRRCGQNNPEVIKIKATVIILVLLSLFTTAHADNSEDTEIISLIKACADIGNYDCENGDDNELMLRFLYTYRNFEIITDTEPLTASNGKIKMCDEKFVQNAFWRAFRKTAPSPDTSKLTELKYCKSGKYYQYIGEYSEFFATDVLDITEIIQLSDGTFYAVFRNTYKTETTPERLEYSFMRLGRDKEGYYVLSINMNDTFANLKSQIQTANQVQKPSKPQYAPIIVITVTLSGICFMIWYGFLR